MLYQANAKCRSRHVAALRQARHNMSVNYQIGTLDNLHHMHEERSSPIHEKFAILKSSNQENIPC